MTIREFYEWALENHCEGYEILISRGWDDDWTLRSAADESAIQIDDDDQTVTI
jgi:hypothetical protein